MNRQEALQWCVENIDEWCATGVSHNHFLTEKDDWAFFFSGEYFRMINVCKNPESPITKRDWLEAKKTKEKAVMNRDLMMRAAIQFEGVWPDGATHILSRGGDSEPYDWSCFFCVAIKGKGFFDYSNLDGIDLKITPSEWQQFCTREQFEDFVESLFDGAPDDATHKGTDNLFYKHQDIVHFYNDIKKSWRLDGNGKDWLSKNLIPRPAKKAESPITKRDWLEAKKNKEKAVMNRDLMMRAAIQFEGVWPRMEYEKMAVCLKDVVGGTAKKGDVSAVDYSYDGEYWEKLCTREQFEDFVESLFDGAPEGTTHYSFEDDSIFQVWWKINKDGVFLICEEGDIYTWERETGSRDRPVLVPRPAKRVDPQAQYMPKVGEECEYKCTARGREINWTVCCPKYISNFTVVVTSNVFAGEFVAHPNTMRFRPLRTERDLFIEQATKDYLDQVGSDAVNSKWFERIFGALHDAGNLLYKN